MRCLHVLEPIVWDTCFAATDATILSVDGIGAYDHVLRASGNLVVRAPQLRESVEVLLVDEDGQRRTVVQAEGGETR